MLVVTLPRCVRRGLSETGEWKSRREGLGRRGGTNPRGLGSIVGMTMPGGSLKLLSGQRVALLEVWVRSSFSKSRFRALAAGPAGLWTEREPARR